MRALVQKVYHRLPGGVRRGFDPGLRLLGLLRGLRPEIYLAEGNESSGGRPLSILCAAGQRERSYLCRMTFGPDYRERFLGRAWLWRIGQVARRRTPGCSLAWIQTRVNRRKYLRDADCAWIPAWLMGVVRLPYPPEVEKNERLRSDIRRMARYGLSYEITRDLGRLEDFFHHMYVPYVSGSHGASAHMRSYATVLSEFPHCELLVVRREGKDVAGCLISYDPRGPRIWLAGIRDGDRDALMAGTASSLFHFASVYLQEKGHRRLMFGLSRAFFRDGVFHFKKKWAQEISDTRDDYFALRILRSGPAVQDFLLAQPFICDDRGVLVGVIFVPAGPPLGPEDLRKIEKSFAVSGLTRLQIRRLAPAEDAPAASAPAGARPEVPPQGTVEAEIELPPPAGDLSAGSPPGSPPPESHP